MKKVRTIIVLLSIVLIAMVFDRLKPSQILRQDLTLAPPSQSSHDSAHTGGQIAAPLAVGKAAPLPAAGPTTSHPASVVGESSEALSTLRSGEQESLWTAFAEARREVRPILGTRAERPENLGFDFYALHPKQNLTTRFGSGGVQLVSSDRTYTEADAADPTTAWTARMRLLSFAGESVPQAPSPVKSQQKSSLVEFHHHPGLVEWYDNGIDGVEHGYTIAARPAHLKPGVAVSFEVAVDGLQVSERDREIHPEGLAFMDGVREVLSYSKLFVVDALGTELPATMKPTDHGFALAYQDANAVYPVTVDPLIVNEEAKLNRLNAAEGDFFGKSVAISGDSAVVGVHQDDDGGSNSGSAYVFVRSGTSWLQQQKLTASDAAAGDAFGYSVGISGDSIVVGAYLADGTGTNSGSAYVFARSGSSWSEQTKLTANDAGVLDLFGFSVAISGDSVAVGARADGDAGSSSGSAYVFFRSGTSWSQQQKLTAADAAAGDEFGSAVSISVDSIVVGAPQDDDGGLESGSAYVFIRSGTSWSQQKKLTATDAAAGDRFGWSVAIDGNIAVVGAPQDDDAGANSGSAYAFIRSGSTWSTPYKLAANDAFGGDLFGNSVAISGDIIMIGAQQNDDNGFSSGSAYTFVRVNTSWVQQTKLTSNDASGSDLFGYSVAISGDYAIVGAYRDDFGATDSGSSYVFVRNENFWNEQAKLTASDAAPFDQFGVSVAIAGDSIVVGANDDDDAAMNSGSAYVFIRSGSKWSQQAKLTADDAAAFNDFGHSVAISGDSIVVGAHRNFGGSASGSAYVFVRSGSTWSQQAKLTTNDTEENSLFGYAVSISGDRVVVGVEGDFNNLNTGSAYVFVRSGSTWFQQAKLTANDAAPGDQFGHSVAISGDSVVVGSVSDDRAGSVNSGSAYVFGRSGSTWIQQAKLTANDAAAGDFFGNSVAIAGKSVVVGAFGNDDAGSGSGSAYVFARSGSTWTQQAKLTASDAAASDFFGNSVAISGDSVVVGANGNDDAGSASGSAYVFVRSGSTWAQESKLTANDATINDEFGYSVAISGNSVVVGAWRDDDGGTDSGSVYIYRFNFAATNKLLAFDHLGNELRNTDSATPFPGQLIGTANSFTFRLADAGSLEQGLDIQTVTLGGANPEEFLLVLPDISSDRDITVNGSLDFTISFHPTGSTSGARNASVIVTSNDLSQPVFSFGISGLGFSNTTDGDGDGMTDWAEYSLRGFGFDWQGSQPNLVHDFYAQANTAGLFTPEEIGAVQGSVTLFQPNLAAGTVDLVIELEQSPDLGANTFTPMILEPTKLSVDPDGNIRYELDLTPDKKFFRAGWKGE